MSRWQHEVLDSLSLSIYNRYHPSLLTGLLLSCILCPHRTDVSFWWSSKTGTSMYRSSLENVAYEFFQQCSGYLARLNWMVCEIGGKLPYSCCFEGYCSQDLIKIEHSILVWFPPSFFSVRFISVHVVHS